MAEFAFKNAKNASIGHTPFELNCCYHFWMLYKEKVNSCFKSKSTDKLSAKLRELIIVCQENLHHTQELQKQAHNKGVKPRSCAPSKKVWLNCKYFKTKHNRKLEVKFFKLFQVLYPIKKQVYKLELPRKWRIHNVFHVSLLEQINTKKGRVDKKVKQMEFDIDNNDSKKYKIKAIQDSAVYAKELESGYLSGFYYLIL